MLKTKNLFSMKPQRLVFFAGEKWVDSDGYPTAHAADKAQEYAQSLTKPDPKNFIEARNDLKDEVVALIPEDRTQLNMQEYEIKAEDTYAGFTYVLKEKLDNSGFDNNQLLKLAYAYMYNQNSASINDMRPGDKVRVENGTMIVARNGADWLKVDIYPWEEGAAVAANGGDDTEAAQRAVEAAREAVERQAREERAQAAAEKRAREERAQAAEREAAEREAAEKEKLVPEATPEATPEPAPEPTETPKARVTKQLASLSTKHNITITIYSETKYDWADIEKNIQKIDEALNGIDPNMLKECPQIVLGSQELTESFKPANWKGLTGGEGKEFIVIDYDEDADSIKDTITGALSTLDEKYSYKFFDALKEDLEALRKSGIEIDGFAIREERRDGFRINFREAYKNINNVKQGIQKFLGGKYRNLNWDDRRLNGARISNFSMLFKVSKVNEEKKGLDMKYGHNIHYNKAKLYLDYTQTPDAIAASIENGLDEFTKDPPASQP